MAKRTPEQQAAIDEAIALVKQRRAQGSATQQLTPRQVEAIQETMARLRANKSRAFASPVIDERFYRAGEQAEDLSVRPDMADIDPMAMSEGGINIGTPLGREMAGRLAARGQSLGLSEPLGALKRSVMTGTSFGEQLAKDKELMKQYEEAIGPTAAIATEVAGGVSTPFSLLKTPQAIQKLGVGKQAAIKSGAAGAVYGAATGEGGIAERGQRAIEVAIPSALFGVTSEKIVAPVMTKTLAALTGQNAKAPTIEGLKKQRDLAYKQADEVESLFGVNDYNRFIQNASKRIEDMGFDPDVDKQVTAAIKQLTKKQGTVMTLKEMDKVRQGLWTRYNNGSPGEKRIIREVIDELDNTIETQLSASQNETLSAARVSHKQYKKAELIEEAFENAQRQAAATGSGGNVENLYRQAVNRIMKSKDARYFSQEELDVMDQFIKGDFTQNIARLFGKLSPSGNGLMMALNLGAVATDPTFVLATIAGASSKAFADQRVKNEARKIIEMMGMDTKTVDRMLGVSGASATISGQATEQENSNDR